MKKRFIAGMILFQMANATAEVLVSPQEQKPLGFFASRDLQHKFRKAQAIQLEAIKNQQRNELKALKSSQASGFKEWSQKEKAARQDFFRDHPKGSDRRAYIQDWVERRKAFLKSQEDQKIQLNQEFEARIKAVREDYANKYKEFKKYLSRGEQPPASLWP